MLASNIAAERSEFMKETPARLTPLKSTWTGNAVEHRIGAGKVNPFLLKSVGDLKREYGVGIKHRSGKIGVHEGDPSEIDPAEVDIAGNAVEHCIGAGKVGPFYLKVVSLNWA